MNKCVNISSREFKDTCSRLDISAASLENIIHDYMESEGNAEAFPSDSYIISRVTEGKNEVVKENLDLATEVWKARYSDPIVVNTEAEVTALSNQITSVFSPEAVKVKETLGGQYVISVAKPSLATTNNSNIKTNSSSNLYHHKVGGTPYDILNDYSGNGVIHKRFGRFFVTKASGATEAKAVDAFREFAYNKGISDFFTVVKAGNAYEIIPEKVSVDKIYRSTSKADVDTVFKFFKDRFTGLSSIKNITASEANRLTHKSGVKAFIKDGVVYLVGENVTKDTLIEECLHPFTNDLFRENRALFDSLLNEAKRYFRTLARDIRANYTDTEGFTQQDRDQELVTQVLSRYMRNEMNKAPESLIDKIKEVLGWVVSKLKSLLKFNNATGNYEITTNMLDSSMTFEDLAGLINTSNSKFIIGNDGAVRYNKSTEVEPVREELLKGAEVVARKIQQINNLTNSGLFEKSEVREQANRVVYFISDIITDFISNPTEFFEIFDYAGVEKKGEVPTEEELKVAAEKISNMERVDVVRLITPEKLIRAVKDQLFSAENNPEYINTLELMDKADLLSDNFEGLLWLANDAFAQVENFSIAQTQDSLIVREENTINIDDFNWSEDLDSILENEGSVQEHWQVAFRTQDVMQSMSQLIRQDLNKCYELDSDGNIVTDEFGICKRIKPEKAVSSILTWLSGSNSLSEMEIRLKDRATNNPWLTQIVDKISDKSGKYADYQSQFFGVFSKVFQKYSITKTENTDNGKKLVTMVVNESPALKEARNNVKALFRTGLHPLFTNEGVNKNSLETLSSINDVLQEIPELTNENLNKVITLITRASQVLGYDITEDEVYDALNEDAAFSKITNSLNYIVRALDSAKEVKDYDPFKFKGENSIGGNLSSFLEPLTALKESTAISSVYDNGKMYQSYVTPSYLTTMMTKFGSDEASFKEFLDTEYGQYEWFKDNSGWRLSFLEKMEKMTQEERKKFFQHKVELSFNKHNYMKNLSPLEYTLSVFTNFATGRVEKGGIGRTWFRVPMQSNKPSSEFISGEYHSGPFMKRILTEKFYKIFQQELSRIQTCTIRDYQKSDPEFIKAFDANGKKFCMLTFLNDYLEKGSKVNSKLGRLINKAITEGTSKLSDEELNTLTIEAKKAIQEGIEEVTARNIVAWKKNGIFEKTKTIEGVGSTDVAVEEFLTEFVWNDAYSAMAFLELTVTDPAFYKDAEDLQKRLAEIHAPGTKPNIEATDYEGHRVGDGIFRTVVLTDFDDFISNIIENLSIVFDRKVAELPENSPEAKSYREFYNSVLESYKHINVADAQGFSCPTSYRKKAFYYGRWSKKSEEIYKNLLNGVFTMSDIKEAFQVLKPTVYGHVSREACPAQTDVVDGATKTVKVNTPLSKLKIPVYFKNSEYLLVMAGAILQNEETGKPNLLRAIYNIMEDSAARNDGRGIDTIQFESACKSGLSGRINIKQFADVQGGETLAENELRKCIFNKDGSYNSDIYVYEVPFESYAIQQENSDHLKDHKQAQGSQGRYIIPSGLPEYNYDGTEALYEFTDKGVKKSLTAKEFKAEYEDNISQQIYDSVDEVCKEFGLNATFVADALNLSSDEASKYLHYLSDKDVNLAMARVLQNEILTSPRYGVELLQACSVDENGEFAIPLGDPIQSKRIEQLLNSAIKNAVNKQEIAGGPVVQVSNFGTSRELNIIYKDRNGHTLMTKSEFAKSAPNNGKSYNIDSAYKQYLKDNNQAGVAYYEVYISATSTDLMQFANKDGVIDIDTVNKIDPELLKLIGYRIPTEDKYSMAPLKIVGFLPKEAGAAIMLPPEITLITGSDFDVDKFYIMRKELMIMSKYLPTLDDKTESLTEDAKKYLEKNKKEVVNYLKDNIPNKEVIQLTDKEEELATRYVKAKYETRRKAAEETLNKKLSELEDRYDLAGEVTNNLIENNPEDSRNDKYVDKLNEDYDRKEKAAKRQYDLTISRLAASEEDEISNALNNAKERKLESIVNDFISSGIFTDMRGNEVLQTLKDAYISYMFNSVAPTEGRAYRNNKTIDMSWAVLTHESTAATMLNPGGFDPETITGYAVEAKRLNPNLDWNYLKSLSADELKSLCYTSKNLCFIDTHLQFYKQNSAASTALGMAAVQKIAHSVLEGDGLHIDIANILSDFENSSLTLGDAVISGFTELDPVSNRALEVLDRTLGEFVAMFADAVKAPVANLMNISNTTMPIFTSLIRLGVEKETAMLFMSQPAVTRALEVFDSVNIDGFKKTFKEVVADMLAQVIEDANITDTFKLSNEGITTDELIDNLGKADNLKMDYKTLEALLKIAEIAEAVKAPTQVTRLNSISSAVGPLIIDNIIAEELANSADFSNLYNKNGVRVNREYILNSHPILKSFSLSKEVADLLFRDFPVNSRNFRKIFSNIDDVTKRGMMKDRKLLGDFVDFYSSYLLVAADTIPTNTTKESPYQGLKYYIYDFPTQFIKRGVKQDPNYKGNALIDAIRVDEVNGRPVLRIDITGRTTTEKETLSSGWADLYRKNQKLALHLFYYNFFRTGIGFSPKSFMALLPLEIKTQIVGYKDTFKVRSASFANNVSPELVFDQFVRNNWSSNKLAPTFKLGEEVTLQAVKDAEGKVISYKVFDKKSSIKDRAYIKIKSGKELTLYRRNSDGTYSVTTPLGNNGEYFEVSASNIKVPLNITSVIEETTVNSQIEEVGNSQQEAIPVQEPTAGVSQDTRAEKIHNMLVATYREGSEGGSFNEQSNEDEGALTSQMKNQVKKTLDKLGIQTNEQLLEEEYRKLC